MKIVTSEQMRRIEERSEQAGVSTDTLMENAGLEVAKRARHHLGRVVRADVIVLVGSGNNGGDGLVAARHLLAWGARVTVYLCRDRPGPDPNLVTARDRGAAILEASKDEGLLGLSKSLKSAAMVVDAVLGTGASRPIEGLLRDILTELAQARRKRPVLKLLALDMPTGLNADTGAVDPASPASDITVTLGYPKVGLYAFSGAEHAGVVEAVDIGVPAGLDADIDLELMTPSFARAAVPHRPQQAHKGTFGRTLVVAGSNNYVGAASLAATAAGRVGAGLVTVAIPESLRAAVAARAAEPTYLPLPESSPGAPSAEAADVILDNLAGYSSLLIGCGLGQASETGAMLERLLYSRVRLPPTVVDADGLNFLSQSQHKDWWERFPSPAIVTPHPGEMSRLSGEPTKEVQARRVAMAVESARKWGKLVVLKGAYTVVAAPDGRAMLSPFANPGLASAGTGDVLAGAIAGLLAQGLSLEGAAALGVYLHGLAGEHVRSELGDTGLLASDLLPALPKAIREVRG